MPAVVVAGDRHAGQAIDLRSYDLAPSQVAAAVTGADTDEITATAPPPGPVYEYVGTIVPDRSYPVQAALAAAARARGLQSTHAAELSRLQADINRLGVDVPTPEATAAKRTIAEQDLEALTDRLATLRGRIEEQRRTGDADAALVEKYRDLAATLSEQRLETAAARQEQDRERAAAAELRDRLERRLRLEDRKHNLERQARRELADRLERQFDRAVAGVPGPAQRAESAGDTTAALAVARLAPIWAPVVVACDRFETPVAARAALDAPVLLLAPR